MQVLRLEPLHLDHERAQLEEVELVFDLIIALISGDLIVNLANQVIVRIVEDVNEVNFDNFDQFFVGVFEGVDLEQGLLRTDFIFLLVFEATSRHGPLLLAEVHHVQVLGVNIREHLTRAVRSRDLYLRAKFAGPCTSDELALVFEFLHHISDLLISSLYLVLRNEDLLRRKVFENLIMYFQNMHTEHFAERRVEVLTHEVDGLEDLLLVEDQEQSLLKLCLSEAGVCLVGLGVGNGEQLLEYDYDQLDHLLVLLGHVLHLEEVGEVFHENFDHLPLQEALLVLSQHFQHLSAVLALRIAPRHHLLLVAIDNILAGARILRQLHDQPARQE